MSRTTFAGTYSSSVFYARGTVVAATAGGALWQARHDTTGETLAAAYWTDVSATALDLTHADLDPSAGSGVDAAIGSTFADVSTGFYVKHGGAATDWLLVEPA